MRTIRFRAWDSKKMIEFGLFDYDCGYCPEANTELDKCPIMQYIGLHDKNGRDIYEGDIVSDELLKANVPVEYFNATFCVKGERQHWIIGQSRTNRMVVIGNIYETPELLKEKPQ